MKDTTMPRASQRGFTLIELLITIVIVGILAAIAFQGMNIYRDRAFNAAVKTDLKNALAAEEAYFSDYGAYVAFSVVDGGTSFAPDFTASQQVTITATLVGPGLRL
ncbi:MAG TPA: prepilin-type N-terminal cleavage/methylation domain-containing protein, partial [Gemmatimonadota bacterium]|nr:prepilin-type N-terminal cleavage/methylation domain-containing protein [Gemmatimonadota bacterium]